MEHTNIYKPNENISAKRNFWFMFCNMFLNIHTMNKGHGWYKLIYTHPYRHIHTYPSKCTSIMCYKMMVFGMFNGEEYFLNGDSKGGFSVLCFGYWRED